MKSLKLIYFGILIVIILSFIIYLNILKLEINENTNKKYQNNFLNNLIFQFKQEIKEEIKEEINDHNIIQNISFPSSLPSSLSLSPSLSPLKEQVISKINKIYQNNEEVILSFQYSNDIYIDWIRESYHFNYLNYKSFESLLAAYPTSSLEFTVIGPNAANYYKLGNLMR